MLDCVVSIYAKVCVICLTENESKQLFQKEIYLLLGTNEMLVNLPKIQILFSNKKKPFHGLSVIR